MKSLSTEILAIVGGQLSTIFAASSYNVVDVGCFKKSVKAKDAMPSHSELFDSPELLNIFRYIVLREKLVPISVVEFIQQKDIKTVDTHDTHGVGYLYRVRKLGLDGAVLDCPEEKEFKKK